MRIATVGAPAGPLDFETARGLADEVAAEALESPVCLSWYDRDEDRESPAHVGECHEGCELRGYEEYAVTRGAELKVVVGEGMYSFCCRPLGEFGEG